MSRFTYRLLVGAIIGAYTLSRALRGGAIALNTPGQEEKILGGNARPGQR